MTTTAPVPPAAPTEITRLRARGRLRGGLPLLGPAFVAAIAYVDPGNFATNTAAGSTFGYQLLWVIAAANLIAMLVQHLSAKLVWPPGATCPSCAGSASRRAPPRPSGRRPSWWPSPPTWPS